MLREILCAARKSYSNALSNDGGFPPLVRICAYIREFLDLFKNIVLVDNVYDEDEQEDLIQEWEQLEEELGRDNFKRALMGLATASLQKKLVTNTETDYLAEYFLKHKKRVVHDGGGVANDVGKRFFKDVLQPRVRRITKDFIHGSSNSQSLSLSSLSMASTLATKGTHAEWLPVAISLYESAGEFDGRADAAQGDTLTKRLKKLATLEAYFMLAKTPAKARFVRCMAAIREPDIELELQDRERKHFLMTLKDDFSKRISAAKLVLWCLNENENFTANDTLLSRGTTLTLEHVLPQKPEKASEWMSIFPDKDEREMWTNKLSNLTLINGKRNASMSNNDYAKKQELMRKIPSNFPLTTQAFQRHDEWTPEVLEERETSILDAAVMLWELEG